MSTEDSKESQVLYHAAKLLALEVASLWQAPQGVIDYLRSGDEESRPSALADVEKTPSPTGPGVPARLAALHVVRGGDADSVYHATLRCATKAAALDKIRKPSLLAAVKAGYLDAFAKESHTVKIAAQEQLDSLRRKARCEDGGTQ